MHVTVRQKEPGKGKPYYVFICYKGQRKARKIGTKEKAELVAAELEKKLERGDLTMLGEQEGQQATSAAMTFGQYADDWYRSYAKAACELSTSDNYASIIRVHLKPELEDKPIDQIDRKDVKRLILKKLEEGLDVKTIRNIRLCLSTILSSAVEDELIPGNPAGDLGKKMRKLLKKKGKKNVNFLRREESTKFLDTIWQFFPLFYAFFLTALRTGMRLGELLGLQPGDINFEEGYIYVQRAIVRGKQKPYPKNGKARRVDMSQQLADTLRLHLEWRKRDAAEKGWIKPPVWLFYNEEGSFLDPANLRKRVFNEVLKKAELRRIRIHDLRHTFASQLIANNESLAYVKEQMGHSSIQVTVDLYGHLVPGANRQAVDKLDDKRAVAQPHATNTQPETPKTQKRARRSTPKPLKLLNCGGKI